MHTERTVDHKPTLARFEYPTNQAPAVLEYHLDGQLMTMHRTFVPQALRGQQVAAKLTKAAFAYAREQGYQVRLTCSYLEAYAQRHPEAAALL